MWAFLFFIRLVCQEELREKMRQEDFREFLGSAGETQTSGVQSFGTNIEREQPVTPSSRSQ